MLGDPLVSIVITTKNEEKNIDLCLRSIVHQTWKNIEVIVVDNNSTDKTKEIAGHYTEKVYNLGPERSAQRNYGMMKAASGDYVMYVDADMILHPDLIERCLSEVDGKSVLALYIPEVILGHGFLSQVRRFERSFYDGTVIDCVRFIRKDVFLEVGGFDETINGPEDWDLDKKIRQRGRVGLLMPQKLRERLSPESWGLFNEISSLGIDPHQYSAVIYHNESQFNLKTYLRKKKYYSLGFSTYKSKWGENDYDIRKQFGFKYRFFGVFLEEGRWKKMFSHPILTCGMYLLRIMVGFVYLFR